MPALGRSRASRPAAAAVRVVQLAAESRRRAGSPSVQRWRCRPN